MRKRARLLLALLACGLLRAAPLPALSDEPEPSYGGKPLSYWVLAPDAFDTRKASHTGGLLRVDEEPLSAINQIGTNAVPHLLAWITYEAPDLPSEPGDDDRFRLAEAAPVGFAALGVKAAFAIPDLARLTKLRPASRPAERATRALGSLGTNAIPALLEVFQNQQHPCRYAALGTLAGMPDIAQARQIVVPELLKRLKSTNDPSLVIFSAQLLGNIQCDPELCIPALLACVATNRPVEVQMFAAGALAQFGSLARPAIPALQRCLNDPDPTLRKAALDCLARIAPDKFTNAPAPPPK